MAAFWQPLFEPDRKQSSQFTLSFPPFINTTAYNIGVRVLAEISLTGRHTQSYKCTPLHPSPCTSAMPELLPKGKIIHPPLDCCSLRNSQLVAKAIHTSPDKYHNIWQGKKGICGPYILIRAQNTTPTHKHTTHKHTNTPTHTHLCFCGLQKGAVKD